MLHRREVQCGAERESPFEVLPCRVLLSQPGKCRAEPDLQPGDRLVSLVGRSGLLGILAGMTFGVSAVGYRGGILGVKALGEDHFVVAATSVLVLGLIMQVALLSFYLLVLDRKTLGGILAAWRPSILAGFMGALASQFWFLAFSVDTAARVRTLAIIEIFFAQIVSRSMFKQGITWREGLGIALIVAGVVWLLSGT